MLHLGIIAQFSIPHEYMQCQLYIVIILELAAENFNFCTFELLHIICEHAPSIAHIIVFITTSHRIGAKLIQHLSILFVFLDYRIVLEKNVLFHPRRGYDYTCFFV